MLLGGNIDYPLNQSPAHLLLEAVVQNRVLANWHRILKLVACKPYDLKLYRNIWTEIAWLCQDDGICLPVHII